MYVVEGREFRNLLLFLREGLEDKDIPHRTQIRTAIMRHFKEYYNVLKEELAVSKFLIDSMLGVHFFCFTIGLPRANQFYCRPVVEQNALSLLRSNSALDGQEQDYGDAPAE
jgi:hypothetical protein